MPIKSFRGLMADGTQDTIVLHTNNGSIGYRIVKFQIMSSSPGATNTESLVQIFKVKQTEPIATSGGTVDFSNQTLLGAAFIKESADYYHPLSDAVIFDQEIFNQDIYVTHTNQEGTLAVNYYIELEQVKLDLSQNTVATLKDIRNKAVP